MSNIIDLQKSRQARIDNIVFNKWVTQYKELPIEYLLQELIGQVENKFPLRKSDDYNDRMKYKAMIEVLYIQSQTDHLKNLLNKIKKIQGV